MPHQGTITRKPTLSSDNCHQLFLTLTHREQDSNKPNLTEQKHARTHRHKHTHTHTHTYRHKYARTHALIFRDAHKMEINETNVKYFFEKIKIKKI